MFNIAFFADSHIGYRAKVPSNNKGINIRVQDGYDAFRETLNQIIQSNTKIDAVVHGGDLFHHSKPSIRDIATVQFYLKKLSSRDIPFYGLAGNHDANDIKSEMAAVAAVNDPDRRIFALYEPYAQYNLTDGIVLHSVSHHGLGGDAPAVKAVTGALNIFTTHGAALDPKNKELLRCADSPREQIIPLDLITDDDFVVKLLGHYHSRYPVGGKSLNTWYSGSSVRRGFSDAPGERGWLLVQVDDNGTIKVFPQNITQRPQFDLEPIDAIDLSPSDVMDKLELNMNRTKEVDKEPIVRQRVLNASRSLREGLDRDKIGELSAHMLQWQLEFPRPEQVAAEEGQKMKDLSLSSHHAINVVEQYDQWMKSQLDSIPDEFKEAVETDIRRYLNIAREAAA
jgi:DNA repair exonuclease SbcCD nuclease subunit